MSNLRTIVKDKHGERIVVWANAVAEARYSLSVPEQRLILWLAAQIERADDALKEWTLSVLEMQEITGGTGGSIYERVKEACDRLFTRKLELQLDEQGWVRGITWMRHVDYHEGTGMIRLRFHDDLKPVLLKLKERFSMIPLKTVFRLRSGYAIRWYELLVARRHLETFSMEVGELRAWLGIEADELPMVKDLRKRAIDVARAELDAKADLTFTYAPIKIGKRITGWRFKVKANHPRPVQRRLPLRAEDPDPERTEEEWSKGQAILAELKAKIRGAA